MDTKIAQKRVNDLAAAMVAKGMVSPEAQLMLKSNAEPCVFMEWKDKSTTYGTAYECARAETVAEAFDAATAFVAAHPTAEQARLNEFLRSLGKVIDIGREYGIEADYLNPLVASMKKLSENIITDQRAA
jgi:hypothetical protein